MSLTLIRPSAHRVMPWKNGGGATAEIAIHPPGGSIADGFDWRFSIATVAGDGPFSAFPQHDRVIMLLSGSGMELDFDDGQSARLDRPFRPLSFVGGRAASCRLIAGPCEDLNLMVARGAFVHTAEVVDGSDWTPGPPGATRILFVLGGSAECRRMEAGPRASRPLALKARDTLVIAPGEPPPFVHALPGSQAFAAAIRRRGAKEPEAV